MVPIPKSTFIVDGKRAEELLLPGRTIPLADESGQKLTGRVLEIHEEVVAIDFNHPLAGVGLFFSIDIKDVRAAITSELEHGHAHSPGGHEH